MYYHLPSMTPATGSKKAAAAVYNASWGLMFSSSFNNNSIPNQPYSWCGWMVGKSLIFSRPANLTRDSSELRNRAWRSKTCFMHVKVRLMWMFFFFILCDAPIQEVWSTCSRGRPQKTSANSSAAAPAVRQNDVVCCVW